MPDNAGNSMTAARMISLTSGMRSWSDRVDSTDANDYYRFELAARATFNLSLSGLSADADVQLLNSSGAQLARSQNSGSSSEAITQSLAAGTYYVRVYPYGQSVQTNYLLSMSATTLVTPTPTTSTAGDDFSASISTAGRLNPGSFTTGNIESSMDTDWLRITLADGQRVQVDLEGSPTGRGSLGDTYLRGIYNSSGALIANTSNDDFGGTTNSRVIFTAPSAGDYYVAAGAYSSGTGTYNLSVTGGTNTAIPVFNISATSWASFEGNSGNSILPFTVSRMGDISHASTVDWSVQLLGSGQGFADQNDFRMSQAGMLTFSAGQQSQTIAVSVAGDTTWEANETFGVLLSNSSGATIGTSAASGIIRNDDSQVLWGTRDLDLGFAGAGANHHFLVILPSNPDDPDLIAAGFNGRDFDGDGSTDGFTIGAELTFHSNTLDVYTNNSCDISAIRGETQGSGSWNYLYHTVPTPDRITPERFIDTILNAYLAYAEYQSNANWWTEIEYEIAPAWSDEGNCASWVNTILQASGLSSRQTEAISDFQGNDYGENHEVVLAAFQPVGSVVFIG